MGGRLAVSTRAAKLIRLDWYILERVFAGVEPVILWIIGIFLLPSTLAYEVCVHMSSPDDCLKDTVLASSVDKSPR